MGYRVAVCVIAVLCTVSANAQTVSGTFQLQDPTHFFGQTKTPQNPLDQSNAIFIPAVILNSSSVPLSIGFEVTGTTQTNNEDWIFNFSNGGAPAPVSTYPVGGNAPASASLHLFFGQTCLAQNGTVTVMAVSADPTTSLANQIQLSFNLDCGFASNISGTFSYLSSGGSGGGGGGTGGTGGGGGSVSTGAGHPPNLGTFPVGGGTTTPAAPAAPVAPPAPALVLTSPSTVPDLNSGDTASVKLTTSGNATFASDVTFSAAGPAGLTFAFSPATIASPGSGTTTLTIGTSDSLQTGLQRVEILAQAANGVIARGAFNINVVCDPPIILGTNQPKTATIASGKTAQLTVKPSGSGPFTYQWYEGHRGSLVFPVSGATGSTLTTPALNAGTEYWVRVTNPCGSVDSQNASVNVKP